LKRHEGDESHQIYRKSDKIIDYTLEEFLGYNQGSIKESEKLLVLGKFKFTFIFDINSYFMRIMRSFFTQVFPVLASSAQP
jgi:hypothetical protein